MPFEVWELVVIYVLLVLILSMWPMISRCGKKQFTSIENDEESEFKFNFN